MGAIADRLATIPTLAGRIHGEAKLSEVMARNQLPQVCPAAFELPLGLRGMAADAATGMYRQSVEWLEGVLLVVRAAGDATGAAGLPQLKPLIMATINAIAGWGPDEAFGVYVLRKGELVSIANGTLTYQLDFAIEDQLRIVR